jgi:hypothetical protein
MNMIMTRLDIYYYYSTFHEVQFRGRWPVVKISADMHDHAYYNNYCTIVLISQIVAYPRKLNPSKVPAIRML